MTDPIEERVSDGTTPRCTFATWKRGIGAVQCRNRAKVFGYYSDLDKRPVCLRHTSTFLYTAPLRGDIR